ncbi:hypothetical protein Lfu02_07170 [Longispora fulva]|uniref:Putative membrane protein n=1 Tax=Longispora fulva TaxID=619741 RepID=A0A8J7GF60_9ACTN|nr:DUF2254 domain-containing protein [Longispora fulva]MBG6135412.1 putative membrane protein [Longispora fulva]GIG56345.1 hypothetical protein Lfu02_07170 [Longispora fulva]
MRHWRERVRSAFWPTPLFLLFLGIVLPTFTEPLDELVSLDPTLVTGTPLTDETNRAVISTIAAAMLSFLGVVFSMSLVGLQLAASQLSPRVLRIYARLRITKITLGVFLATFAYSVTVLGVIGENKLDDGTSYVPIVSLALNWLLLFTSLVLFVFYVNTILRLMRSTYMIEAVASEARGVIDEWYPAARPDESATVPDRAPDGVVLAAEPSVLTSLNFRRLVRTAARQGVLLRVVPRVGDFVARGAPLVQVWGERLPYASTVRGAFHWGRERTLHDDPSYALRLLVDIAIRALSPAVNDPTTAVQAIDRIVDLLADIGARPDAAGVHRDRRGVPRVIAEVPDFASLTRLAFTEIRRYGADAPQVSRRLLAALDDLAVILPPELTGVVAAHRELLAAAVRRAVPAGAELAIALTPDRQGLG